MGKNTLVFVFYFLLTIIITWPLVLNLNRLIIDANDGLLITWFLNWPWHFFSTGGISRISDLYNANIFFPYIRSLAFSETMLPQAIIAAPFILITGEPLLAYNINLLLGFILTGFSCYLLVLLLTKKLSMAILAGVIFTYSTIHINYLAHLQLFNFWPVILAIYFLFRQKFLSFTFFFLVASLTTILNFYFLLTVILLVFVFNEIKRKSLVIWTIFSILTTAPFLVPYYLVIKQFHDVRPINDAINNSLQFPNLINVSIYSRLSAIFSQQPGTPAYFGAVFLGMIILAVRKFKANIWWWLAGVSFILALGPALHIFRNTVHIGPIPAIPLPYAIFYYLVPGFAGFRTPSRWIILTAFALVVAISIRFAKKISWRWALVLSFLVVIEVNFPFKYHRVPSLVEFPPEQVWLKENYSGAPIIQFPIYAWFDGDKISVETLREYYSTIHWHAMFNGYSGFSPKEWEEKVKWLQKDFPSTGSISYLKQLGIKLVLTPYDWAEKIREFSDLKLVATFPTANIYEFR